VENNTTYTVNQTGTGWWGANAGAKLKSQATFKVTDPGDGSWLYDANYGTNSSGFGAVPAGYRNNNGSQFGTRGIGVSYWSSSVGSSSNAWYRGLYYNNAQVSRSLNYRSLGFSVRCVKN
jgi:uncharacterized protein (TIGR02145 family)